MNPKPDKQDEELIRLLGSASPSGRSRAFWLWLAAAGIIVLAAVAYWLLRSGTSDKVMQYQTQAVGRGNLVVTVSATGNLQPTNQVDVGSELSGTVETVRVDDNDRIRKGQVLARLDTAKLKDQIARSRATVASAEAKVAQAGATVREARANLERLREVSRLSGGKVPSQAEMETAEAALSRALSDEASARASVAENRATLSSDETNLSKATIRSPIDGVVLARKVEPGQTVAASLQAPVLFTLAENLTQMELRVDVDEADVGHVREGQSAVFNVDAYPGRKYPARIARVGLGSQIKDGVVSYITVLTVNNDDLSLRPGMTATAEITTASRENVLLVPNAALRFSPPSASGNTAKSGGLVASLIPRFPRRSQQRSSGTSNKKTDSRQVWVLREGKPAAVQITVGATNGRMTEVTSDGLQPGMDVITGMSTSQ